MKLHFTQLSKILFFFDLDDTLIRTNDIMNKKTFYLSFYDISFKKYFFLFKILIALFPKKVFIITARSSLCLPFISKLLHIPSTRIFTRPSINPILECSQNMQNKELLLQFKLSVLKFKREILYSFSEKGYFIYFFDDWYRHYEDLNMNSQFSVIQIL